MNAYLREITGEEFTAKDFRTWNGTREAASVLTGMGAAENSTEAKKNIVEAVKQTARRLGNRPATCKKYYIHPAILDAYEDGSLFDVMRGAEAQGELSCEEAAVMQLLAQHKPDPLRIANQDREVTTALKRRIERVSEMAEVEVA